MKMDKADATKAVWKSVLKRGVLALAVLAIMIAAGRRAAGCSRFGY